jgi:hypothetical protein
MLLSLSLTLGILFLIPKNIFQQDRNSKGYWNTKLFTRRGETPRNFQAILVQIDKHLSSSIFYSISDLIISEQSMERYNFIENILRLLDLFIVM